MVFKNQVKIISLIVSLFILINSAVFGQNRPAKPLYLDSGQSIEKRVEDLLGRMTLKEKVGQMNMPCVYIDKMGKDLPAKIEGCRKFTEGKHVEEIGRASCRERV